MGVTTGRIEVREITRTGDGDGYDPQIVDVAAFFDRVIAEYNEGTGPFSLEADVQMARSIVPAGTGAARDFSYLAPEVPEYKAENCVGCMTCVNVCPDTAILGKVVELDALEQALGAIENEAERSHMARQFAVTNKFYKVPERKGERPGKFGIFVDPTKCKGCAECVEACADLGYNALRMIEKQDETVPVYQKSINFFRSLPPTPEHFISERVAVDMMLAEQSLIYVGGAGSCAGCGEGTALRMWLAALGYQYGRENVGIVAATGCNTVYGSTYPYNPYLVPWTNSLFENAATAALGIRMRWDQLGWQDKLVWALGGDGAMFDIGLQALSRVLASGMNVKAFILDTQVYSNTGGQTSTASFTGQESKMYAFGPAVPGKQESRKEVGRILMMHPHTFVAQVVTAIPNHFYRAVLDGASFPGPAVIIVYTTCQPEHNVGDNMSRHQAKLAVESRAFPVFVYDPRNGETIRERLSLQGNPAQKEDWYVVPKTGEVIDFVAFARTEGRFAKQFDQDGNPSETLLRAQADRLANWRLLQELAGLR